MSDGSRWDKIIKQQFTFDRSERTEWYRNLCVRVEAVMAEETEALRARLQSAEDALLFYADFRKNEPHNDGSIYAVLNADEWHHDGVCRVVRDKGSTARAHFAKYPPQEKA